MIPSDCISAQETECFRADDDASAEDFGDVEYMDEHLASQLGFLDALGQVLRRVAKPAAVQASDAAQPPAEAPLTDGQRFVREFGRMGGVWSVEGKTLVEAEALYSVLIPKPRSNLERVAAGIKIGRR